MTILSTILSFIFVALLLVSSAIGIAFFGSWAWYIIEDFTHMHHHTL